MTWSTIGVIAWLVVSAALIYIVMNRRTAAVFMGGRSKGGGEAPKEGGTGPGEAGGDESHLYTALGNKNKKNLPYDTREAADWYRFDQMGAEVQKEEEGRSIEEVGISPGSEERIVEGDKAEAEKPTKLSLDKVADWTPEERWEWIEKIFPGRYAGVSGRARYKRDNNFWNERRGLRAVEELAEIKREIEKGEGLKKDLENSLRDIRLQIFLLSPGAEEVDGVALKDLVKEVWATWRKRGTATELEGEFLNKVADCVKEEARKEVLKERVEKSVVVSGDKEAQIVMVKDIFRRSRKEVRGLTEDEVRFVTSTYDGTITVANRELSEEIALIRSAKTAAAVAVEREDVRIRAEASDRGTEEASIRENRGKILERPVPHKHFCSWCGMAGEHVNLYFDCKHVQRNFELSHGCVAKDAENLDRWPHKHFCQWCRLEVMRHSGECRNVAEQHEHECRLVVLDLPESEQVARNLTSDEAKKDANLKNKRNTIDKCLSEVEKTLDEPGVVAQALERANRTDYPSHWTDKDKARQVLRSEVISKWADEQQKVPTCKPGCHVPFNGGNIGFYCSVCGLLLSANLDAADINGKSGDLWQRLDQMTQQRAEIRARQKKRRDEAIQAAFMRGVEEGRKNYPVCREEKTREVERDPQAAKPLMYPHVCWTCEKCGDAWEHQAYLSTCESFQEHSRLIHQCGVVTGGVTYFEQKQDEEMPPKPKENLVKRQLRHADSAYFSGMRVVYRNRHLDCEKIGKHNRSAQMSDGKVYCLVCGEILEDGRE